MNYITSGEGGSSGEVVRTVPLDEFCQEAGIDRIDLMKMDIQGAEAAALRGASRLLSSGAIGTLFLELSWLVDPQTCPNEEAVRILHNNGYQFSGPAADWRWRPAGPWLDARSDAAGRRVEERRP